MVLVDRLQNIYADLLEDLGYEITFEDMRSDMQHRLGIYITGAGNGLRKLSMKNTIQIKDVGIRIHGGDNSLLDIQKCHNDIDIITKRLTMYNTRFDGINIIGSTPRNGGAISLGKTNKGVPVFDLHLLVQYN